LPRTSPAQGHGPTAWARVSAGWRSRGRAMVATVTVGGSFRGPRRGTRLPAGAGSFWQLAVEPSQRGTGLGKRLLTLAEGTDCRVGLRTGGDRHVRPQATELVGWYRRRGYVPVGHVAGGMSTNYDSVVLGERPVGALIVVDGRHAAGRRLPAAGPPPAACSCTRASLLVEGRGVASWTAMLRALAEGLRTRRPPAVGGLVPLPPVFRRLRRGQAAAEDLAGLGSVAEETGP